MSDLVTSSPQALRDWFRSSGVLGPLQSCIGPLPASGAAIVRWTCEQPDSSIITIRPHTDSYRIPILLQPLESQIWQDQRAVSRGVIGANRFRICPPGSNGSWRRMSNCDIANIFVPVSLVETLGQQRGDGPGVTLSETMFNQDRHVLDLVGKMLNASTMAGALATTWCDGLMTALVSYLLEHYAKPAAPMRADGLAGWRLQKVLAHIDEHLGEEVPVLAMAESCGMSEAHFSREFRKAVGQPPHQYMTKLRLERASAALLSGQARIIDIAFELGFNDVSHFSRAFALRYGVPPTVYRQRNMLS
ncbi:MAG: AraC family transcriptional regulator [Pseudomonadota bacterium]